MMHGVYQFLVKNSAQRTSNVGFFTQGNVKRKAISMMAAFLKNAVPRSKYRIQNFLNYCFFSPSPSRKFKRLNQQFYLKYLLHD